MIDKINDIYHSNCYRLDRFLLTICTGLYTYLAWRSNGSYEYASRMKQMKKHRL